MNETSGVLKSLLPGVKYNISASALYTVGASSFGKVLKTTTGSSLSTKSKLENQSRLIKTPNFFLVPDFPKIIDIIVYDKVS